MPGSSRSHFKSLPTASSSFSFHRVEILDGNIEMIETISENGFDGIESPVDGEGEVSIESLWRSKVLWIAS